MGLFDKKKPAPVPGLVQTRKGEGHPFRAMENYVPLARGELALYRAIREGVPIVDAALVKLVRLCGGVKVTCAPSAQKGLDRFLETVPTGRGQEGIQSFLDCYLDSMLTCGRAVGEIVPSRNGRGIAALLCGNVEDIEIKEGASPLEITICVRRENGKVEALPYQQLLLFTPYQPEAEHPYGVSLMRSMPFLAGILLNIYQAIGVNWERVGNPRFAILCKPEGEEDSVQERCQQVAQEWARAMKHTQDGSVSDFVAAGEMEIKVIGGEGQIPDSQGPIRQIMEQLVAKTGLPPFLLGLSWTSTERMSSQQADLLTSEITAIRRSLTPVVAKICRLWLRSQGEDDQVLVDWEDVNLQDLMEEARAELCRAQIREMEKEE